MDRGVGGASVLSSYLQEVEICEIQVALYEGYISVEYVLSQLQNFKTVQKKCSGGTIGDIKACPACKFEIVRSLFVDFVVREYSFLS